MPARPLASPPARWHARLPVCPPTRLPARLPIEIASQVQDHIRELAEKND
jgi:hypothetical protein